MFAAIIHVRLESRSGQFSFYLSALSASMYLALL